jgi:hypothetical protein
MFDKQIVKASARNVLSATEATRRCFRASADANAVIGEECLLPRIASLAVDERFARLLYGSKIEVSGDVNRDHAGKRGHVLLNIESQ